MNVVVLGGSSAVGGEIGAEFAPGNRVLLVGRDRLRLSGVAAVCRERGAADVTILTGDLNSEYERVEQTVLAWQPDVLVNAACATSQLRDDAIQPEDFPQYLTVDLIAPLRLITACGKRSPGARKLRVIFVSSLLAGVQSPRRVVYGNLKAIHEVMLGRLGASVSVLVVRVGEALPTDVVTGRTKELARVVKTGFDQQRGHIFFGWKGRLMFWLYHVQPLLFRAVIGGGRRLRRETGGQIRRIQVAASGTVTDARPESVVVPKQ